MPLLRLNADGSRPRLHGVDRPLEPILRRALEGSGPVIVMLHGYKFAPGHDRACPHRHILSLRPTRDCWKAVSWPAQLGFGGGAPGEGLAIAFGWSARGTIWQAYRAAQDAALALAELLCLIHRLAPHRAVHALAHSLGARVVLGALPHLPAGALRRIVLLAGAEYGHQAARALDSAAARSAELINITSRENDLFDFLFERLIAPSAAGDRSLGHGLPERPNALTVQMDCRDTLEALARSGFQVAPPMARICHWSSYLRPGVFDFYRALFRESADLPLDRLRLHLPAQSQPRWSRVRAWPALPRAVPLGRKASL